MSAILSLVSAGLGIAVLPTCLVENGRQPDGLTCVDVWPPIRPVEMYFTYAKGKFQRGVRDVLDATRGAIKDTRFIASIPFLPDVQLGQA